MPATQEDRLYGLTTSVAVKPAVAISADYNITLFGEQTITSSTFTGERTVTTTTGMRVLVMGQSSPIDNGIWIASPATWHRAPDFDGARDAVNGTLVFSIYGDCWQLEAADPVQIGYSALEFRSTYPFNGGLNEFQRSLRVPETSVNILPQISGRANHLLAFNNDGQPVMVLPESGSAADVLLDLASSVDGKGDALVAVKQPFTGSATRTQHSKNADIINLRDADGVDPTGISNSTAGIQSVLNSLGVKGGVVYIGNGDRFIIDSISIPQNVSIVGSSAAPGEVINSLGQTYASFGSQFILTPGSSIDMKRSSSVSRVSVIPQALLSKMPVTSDATADAAIASFAGKAFISIEADFQLRDILVIGFTYPLYVNPTATDTGRRIIENFKYDCTNGPYIEYATDIDRLRGIHGWPYLTAHVSGISASKNNRSGVGLNLKKVADFTLLDCCFNYGYNTGFLFEDVWNITMTGGGADAVGTTGISFQGSCRFSRMNNVIINSNNTGIAINIGGTNPDIKTNHCIINGVSFGVYVSSGSYFSDCDTFMGGTGIAYTDGTISGGILNPYFDGVTTPVSMTSSAEKVVSRGKFNFSPTNPNSTVAEKTFATQSIFHDKRPVAVDTGHFFEQGARLNDNSLHGLWRIGPRLLNATIGSESSNYAFTAYNAGTWVDRWIMTADGTFRPVQDGVQLVGDPSHRCGQIYSSVGTISTSSRESKTEEEEITEIEKKVAIKCKELLRKFRFKDSVMEKGPGARIHFGIIAEDVKLAFESEGLVAEEYGIFCFDQWKSCEAVFDADGVMVAEAREDGTRSGIRYDELVCFILSAI
ncbi:right-handed parallel beta-helix repeat-containing protein [Yersinia aldovae]|uniref:right-handed parallel beta-helix repeat-containing protein n=1 Tax=Yersinia aldovae TaxID=29483 RepID=UPI0005AC3141|nr:right-handed parallel beta-helix repeat-containing protein [Yersinia aldovae]AJJ64870.1 hypothetical protein AT01_1301 [Yersinia aldovae 670-83]